MAKKLCSGRDVGADQPTDGQPVTGERDRAMMATDKPQMPVAAVDQFFIGGAWVEPSSSSCIDVVDPASEETYYQVAEAQAADIDRAVSAARQAFDHGPWPRMTPVERAGFLRQFAAGVVDRSADLAGIWSREMGIIHSVAQPLVLGIGAMFEFYADLADEFAFVERHPPASGGAGYIVREPVGVVGAIIPWNASMAMITYKAAPALLAGCTMVIKCSPESPGAGYVFAEIAAAIDLPPGVINVVTADRDVSELLVRDQRVDKIAFTGSTASGRRIASLCGERIARTTLELGGKSAAVVLDDFDIAVAAETLSTSARFMTGQVCSSLTRIIVSRHRHDDLLEALSNSFAAVRVGDPFDPQTEMGPLAMARQRDKVEKLISQARSEGATLATGGERPRDLDRGYYIEPTVFGHVDNSSTIAREEVFGPVLSVIPADDEAHAIALANDSIYGLNASVFTNDDDRAFAVAQQLRCGTVGHNAFRTDFGMGFGGYKQSGIGREGGRVGLHAYLELKSVILQRPLSDLKI